jgi:hypothetical protein
LVSLVTLMEESLQIAWDFLDRTGEIDDPRAASRYLGDSIEYMIRQGQRSRLVISNRAIRAYQQFRNAEVANLKPEQALR